MSYIDRNFLLENESACKLYFSYAEKLPIYDYHCHLSEQRIYDNTPFKDIYEIWLAGDHYKWRLMRNYGVNEEYITGNKSNKEKFLTYCKVLGTAFGNPLYHWSQLEIEEYFGCTKEINESNAEAIWNECNEYIASHNVTPQSLIEQSGVSHVFTTNEVYDDLSVFGKIADKGYKFKVLPSFRADKMVGIDDAKYCDYVAKLGAVRSLSDFENALESKLELFVRAGAKVSDISLQHVCPIAERKTAEAIFERRLKGTLPSSSETDEFKGYLTYYLMKLYAGYGIVSQLHVGALRNNNSAALKALGPDTGFDSVAEDNSINNMSRLFDRLNSENALPKTIVFNLNPKMNVEIMTLIGCFQSDEARGKIQYGPAWWFLDNKSGMEKHLADLTATGHIGAFIGMLTDSRSLLSYPRHRYFRRILCNYLGGMMERGLMTRDEKLVGKVVADICYNNANTFFGG